MTMLGKIKKNGGQELLVNIPMPQKKEFASMSQLLHDAERFYNNDELEVSKNVLKILQKYIDEFNSIIEQEHIDKNTTL